MKKIIYNIIKYPLIIIFIKTPLINILKKRFKNYRSIKNRNIIWLILDVLFWREYLIKLKDKIELRELTDSTLMDEEGRKWALHYYHQNLIKLKELKTRRTGNMSTNDAEPIYEKMINFIKSNNLTDDQDTYIIQLGSSSGRVIEFFLKTFPKLNYISTDINDEILDFQKEKYNYSNLKYFKCHAEDIDECINNFNICDKNIIVFSIGSLQYVNPFFLKTFFLKLRKYPKLNFFAMEPISLSFIDNNKKISDHRVNISFSHRYNEYVRNSNANIAEFQVIRPYSKDDKQHGDTGHFYLHVAN